MISKEKKSQIIKELLEEIKKAKAIYFINFLGAKVTELDELRSELKKSNARGQVVKKNLAQVILSQAGYQQMINREKEGSLMFCLASEDCFKTAKALLNFSKKNDKIQIIGAAAEGKFLNEQEVAQLAKISSEEMLYGRLVGSMASSIQRLVYVLNGNIQKFVVILEGIKATK